LNERAVAAVLLSLPPVYLAAVLLVPIVASSALVAAAFVVTLAIALGASRTGSRPRRAVFLLTALLAVALAVAYAGAATFGPAPDDLLAGTLLGLPWIASVFVVRAEEPFGVRAVAFGSSTLLGLLYLAAAGSIGGPGAALSSATFLDHLASTNVNEASGIAGLFLLGPASPPVASLFDPVYALLTGVGALGFLLVVLRPRTGGGTPLPIALEGTAPSRAELSPAYGFSPDQRVVFATRSRAESPGTPWPPGFDAVAVAGVVSALFVGAAILSPYYAIAGLTVVLLALVALVLFAIERPAPYEPPEPPTERATPPSGAPAAPEGIRPPSPPAPGG